MTRGGYANADSAALPMGPLYGGSGQGPGGVERLSFARLIRVGIAGAALILSGCATTRYVTIHCVSPEQYQKLKDAEPPRVGDKLTGQAQDDLKTIAGSTVELRTYSEGLLGVLGGCVDPNKS